VAASLPVSSAAAMASGRLPTLMVEHAFAGFEIGSPAESQLARVRACGLLLQAFECNGGQLPTTLASLAVPIVIALQPPALPAREWDDTSRAHGELPTPATWPLEPEAVAMLTWAHDYGVPAAIAAAASGSATSVQMLIETKWPKLMAHLLSICSRLDLADVNRRREGWRTEGVQPPRTTLQGLIDEVWLRAGFVGSLPRDSLLWVWDQLCMQGWEVAAQIAAAGLWLIRREVRRLDHAGAGATELRDAFRSQLRELGQRTELQALVGANSASSRQKVAHLLARDGKPQVMHRTPRA